MFALAACHRTSATTAVATVTRIGVLDYTTADGGTVEGLELRYAACPDVSEQLVFDSAGPGARALPPAAVTCLRGLGVGAKVDVSLTVHENLAGSGGTPRAVGACALPDDFEVLTKTVGPGRCPWMR